MLDGAPIRWPTNTLTNYQGQALTTGAFDARAVTAWLMKGPLLARLEAEIDVLADHKAALSTVQRRAEDARVRKELLALERQEDAVIVSARPAFTGHRRRSADPRAVLELAEDLPGYATY